MFFFSFNDTATTEIYTLSLHDALPIYPVEELADGAGQHVNDRQSDQDSGDGVGQAQPEPGQPDAGEGACRNQRSEEHTSELQSHSDLVCRLLLEKKKKKTTKRREDKDK